MTVALPRTFGLDFVMRGYRDGSFTPRSLAAALRARIAADTDFPAWIHVLSEAELDPIIRRLEACDPDSLPLWGIPFGIKDNIDLAGVPTTAACPEFSYVPDASAAAVQWLLEAGALPLGKTNLDQFATGLVGARSPYGAVPNPLAPDRVAGGSSSGSAAALALGHVAFTLGTDTAGSGRVPAAFCNLIGVKASKGLISTRGVVPACRSLDCVTVFAHSLHDAMEVTRQVARFDPADPFSRPAEPGPAHARLILRPPFDQTPFFGDQAYEPVWRSFAAALPGHSPWPVAEADCAPLFEAARLLYHGPWIAERLAGLEEFVSERPEALLPVTRAILEGGRAVRATEAFRASETMAALRRRVEPLFAKGHILVLPTAGHCPTLAEVEAEPVLRNTELGTYTNFMNLLDLCALAIPCGRSDAGVPFGITLIADRFSEDALFEVAAQILAAHPLSAPSQTGGAQPHVYPPSPQAPPSLWHRPRIPLAVFGAHLKGLPLHFQLEERDASYLGPIATAPKYRFFALPTTPPKPGAITARSGETGVSVRGELYALAPEAFGTFVAAIPAPLGIGDVELDDGRKVKGFICDPEGLDGARDISDLGDWRAYLQRLRGD